MNLPDKPQLPVTELSEFRRPELTNVMMSEVYRTARRRVQTAQKMQQCALPRAGLADQSEPLPLRDFQIELIKDHQVRIAGAVPLLELNRAEYGIGQWAEVLSSILAWLPHPGFGVAYRWIWRANDAEPERPCKMTDPAIQGQSHGSGHRTTPMSRPRSYR